MEFCPMCRSILLLKEENGRNIGVCRCGFKRTAGISIAGEETSRQETLGAGVASEDRENSCGFSRICRKCGFDKAEAFQIVSNESEITVFKCLKCGDSVRQAQGSSKA